MFRAWAQLVVKHPRKTLLAVLLVVASTVSQARNLRVETRDEDLLPQDHPYVQTYNRINRIFGGGQAVIVGIFPKNGNVFTPAILGKIFRITKGAEALPEVARGSVFSIAANKVKMIRATDDGFEVRSFMTRPPKTEEEASTIRADVLSDDLSTGSLVSRDGTAAEVIVDFPTDVPYPVTFAKLTEIIAPERDAQVDIALAGAPIVLAYIDKYARQMAILFPIAVLIIGAVHYEAFRTIQAVLLPLTTALLSVCVSLGFMGALGFPLDTWSSICPVAILAVAAGHAVQILKRYYEEYAETGDNEIAVINSIVRVGPVMVTAGMIASAGFASLATFAVTSIRVFGLLMACGILSAIAIELSFIPACRVLLPPPGKREAVRERESRWLTPFLAWASHQASSSPWKVMGSAFAIIILAASGIPRLHVDNSIRRWLPVTTQVRVDDAAINERFGGTSTLSLLVDGKSEGAIEDPGVLRAMSDLQRLLQTFHEVGKTISVVDYIKQVHRAVQPTEASKEELPGDRSLIAQYLFLYSMSGPEGLNAVVDPTYRQAVIRAFSKSDATAFADTLFAQVKDFVAERFRNVPATVEVAGGSLGVQVAVNSVIVHEKLRNMLQIGVIILLLSTIVLRSVVGGLLVLVPLVTALVIDLGLMGWTGTSLSMSTAAMTAMGVSIGADFAIYLMFRLQEELQSTSLEQGIERSVQTAGKAILFVSSAVSLGYMVLLFSEFAAWRHLGALSALIMTVASLATVLLLPPMVIVLKPRFLLSLRSQIAEDHRSQRALSVHEN
jgi:predicted RND superfamily exporter protein